LYKELLDLNENRISHQIDKVMRELNRDVGCHVRNAGRDAVLAVIKIYSDECCEKISASRIVYSADDLCKFLENKINVHEVLINKVVHEEMLKIDSEEIAEHHFLQYTQEYMPLKAERLGKVFHIITSAVQDNVELKNTIKNEEDMLKIAKAGRILAWIANGIALGAFIVAGLGYFKPH
jgi:hypothetical protein